MSGEGEKPLRTIRVVAGLLQRDDGKVLITQRRPQAFMPLKWEFPGGKVEPGETDQQALARELSEELNIKVEVGDHFMGLKHAYPDFEVDFQVYACSIISGDLKKLAVNDYRWVAISELETFEFPPADQPTVEQLLK
ncbi:8-oxo-dGTP diphosphatase MutT [Myxococcota bacterium]